MSVDGTAAGRGEDEVGRDSGGISGLLIVSGVSVVSFKSDRHCITRCMLDILNMVTVCVRIRAYAVQHKGRWLAKHSLAKKGQYLVNETFCD